MSSRSFDDIIRERIDKIHQIRLAKALPRSIAKLDRAQKALDNAIE
jgi:hypothetical protein